jgi:hypothetical protein
MSTCAKVGDERARRAETRSRLAIAALVVVSVVSIVLGTAPYAPTQPQTVALANPLIQLGMMVPYFGSKLPEGYVWADGVKPWPDKEWVPAHLRGKPVPNMKGYLIGGAPAADKVGLTWTDGKLSVDGSSFTIPSADLGDYGLLAAAEGGVSPGLLLKWVRGGTTALPNPNLLFIGNNKKEPVHQFVVSEARAKAPKLDGRALNGSCKVNLDQPTSNPQHVMCQWIIRVE